MKPRPHLSYLTPRPKSALPLRHALPTLRVWDSLITTALCSPPLVCQSEPFTSNKGRCQPTKFSSCRVHTAHTQGSQRFSHAAEPYKPAHQNCTGAPRCAERDPYRLVVIYNGEEGSRCLGWCHRRGSNPHASRRRLLRPLRLPIPPQWHIALLRAMPRGVTFARVCWPLSVHAPKTAYMKNALV